MIDVTAGLTAFNGMLNGARALAQMHDESVRLQASIDLQRQIFAAQQDYSALLNTVEELKAKVVSFENWATEKECYEPKRFDPGVTVYVLKSGEAGPERGQHFCPQCYANAKTRILQATDRTVGRRRVSVCLECNVELAYGPQAPYPQVPSAAGRYRPFG